MNTRELHCVITPVPTFRVGIARCESYRPEHTQKALQQAVARAGGWPTLPSSVLLKANLLAPRAPEDAATTHPAILKSVIQELRRGQPDRDITVADTPGFLYAHQREELFERTGLRALAEEVACGVEILSDSGFSLVAPPGARALLQAQVATKFLTAPAVINVAKLKTHVETKISACLKNLFGIADTPTRKRAHAARGLEEVVQRAQLLGLQDGPLARGRAKARRDVAQLVDRRFLAGGHQVHQLRHERERVHQRGRLRQRAHLGHPAAAEVAHAARRKEPAHGREFEKLFVEGGHGDWG